MNQDLIKDIKEYVNYLLLPLENHYYHQYEHALAVLERALYLAQKEWLDEDQKEMLAIAALFHDTGFIIQYEENERIGAKIAQNYLKTMLYPNEKIKIIEKIIIATTPNIEPTNILEEIIKDADMDNLGREDFFTVSWKLRHEKEMIQNIKIKNPDWHHAALDMIEHHRFYTATQRSERIDGLQKNAAKLKKELSK